MLSSHGREIGTQDALGSAEAVLGTSMFSSSETGVSGKFGGPIYHKCP